MAHCCVAEQRHYLFAATLSAPHAASPGKICGPSAEKQKPGTLPGRVLHLDV
jgi:hypothetical protein